MRKQKITFGCYQNANKPEKVSVPNNSPLKKSQNYNRRGQCQSKYANSTCGLDVPI